MEGKNLRFLIILTASIILSYNAINGIKTSFRMIQFYNVRKIQLQKEYIKLIEKQMELKYVTSELYAEQQLRNSLNYYLPGEKVIIFTEPLKFNPAIHREEQPSPQELWRKILMF